MLKHNQNGAISGLAVSLFLTVLLLLGAIGFAGWAYSSRQDYKDNSDKKAAAASEVAVQKESVAKDKQFAEELKKPLKPYSGPAAYGSVQLYYPKSWSGYVDDTGQATALVDGYFNPGVVPSISSEDSVFALRLQVLNQTYTQSVQALQSQQEAGKMQISAYALPKMPKTVGVRATGEIEDGKVVDMVVLPLRSQTVQIWTEGSQFNNDFNKYILPNFSFSP